MYKCDDQCYDYNNGHMCKHIHRVHSMRVSESSYDDETTNSGLSGFEDGDSDSDPISYAESVRSTVGMYQFYAYIIMCIAQ